MHGRISEFRFLGEHGFEGAELICSDPLMTKLRTVEEIWYVLAGRGEMWRRDGSREEVVPLEPDLCLTIPAGTSFRFRATGDSPLSAFAVTMPPWPAGSDDEWVEVAPY